METETEETESSSGFIPAVYLINVMVQLIMALIVLMATI